MVTHQSHLGDVPGQTNSLHKLERLKIPTDLSGMLALDIGCNEGFFCNVAGQRGAQVVGIDENEKFLAEATRRYASDKVSFLNQSWSQLPQGSFDLILWTSAMHYELDPAAVLRNIARALAPDGLFILECGVMQIPRKEMVYKVRHDGGLWYPTLPFLENILSEAGFSHRIISEPELVGTDPVPRVVIHCNARLPTVLLIGGATKSGKSALADMLKQSATKVISLDHFVSRIADAKWKHDKLHEFISNNVDRNNLGMLYDSIDRENLTDPYTSLISLAIARTDKLVVVEGYMTEPQIRALTAKLVNRSRAWVVGRA
jgi:SAM-dependent methyltransferase